MPAACAVEVPDAGRHTKHSMFQYSDDKLMAQGGLRQAVVLGRTHVVLPAGVRRLNTVEWKSHYNRDDRENQFSYLTT